MILNISTGKKFSQLYLFWATNNFFNAKKYGKIITNKDSDFIVKIQRKSVNIVTSTNYKKSDLLIIKRYIETLFKNKSILINYTGDISWLDDIKTVKIYNNKIGG